MIRTAIARAIIKNELLTEDELYNDEGILVVDRIVREIVEDSYKDFRLLPMMVKALDQYGFEGEATSALPPTANEVIARLRKQGVVLTVDSVTAR